MFDGCHSLLIYLTHITFRVAWSITLELTLVESTDKLRYRLFVDITLRETRTDIIMRQLCYRDIQFVAHVTPESTEHLVIELTRLILSHQLRSFLQSFGGNLISFAGTSFGDVGILYCPLTEDDKQRDEHQGEHDD